MSLYISAMEEVIRPFLQGYNSSPARFALNAIHSLWWINNQRSQWVKASSKLSFCAQILLEGIIMETNSGRCFARSILYISKIDNINEAYIKKREARSMIVRTWNGEFSMKNSSRILRLLLTTYHICIYLKECFCFLMTCVDGAKSLSFNKQAQFEALSGILSNSSRAARLIFLPEEAKDLKTKLRHNIELIQTCCRCDKNTAVCHIDTLYKFLLDIQSHTAIGKARSLTASFITTIAPGIKTAENALSSISTSALEVFNNVTIQNVN